MHSSVAAALVLLAMSRGVDGKCHPDRDPLNASSYCTIGNQRMEAWKADAFACAAAVVNRCGKAFPRDDSADSCYRRCFEIRDVVTIDGSLSGMDHGGDGVANDCERTMVKFEQRCKATEPEWPTTIHCIYIACYDAGYFPNLPSWMPGSEDVGSEMLKKRAGMLRSPTEEELTFLEKILPIEALPAMQMWQMRNPAPEPAPAGKDPGLDEQIDPPKNISKNVSIDYVKNKPTKYVPMGGVGKGVDDSAAPAQSAPRKIRPQRAGEAEPAEEPAKGKVKKMTPDMGDIVKSGDEEPFTNNSARKQGKPPIQIEISKLKPGPTPWPKPPPKVKSDPMNNPASRDLEMLQGLADDEDPEAKLEMPPNGGIETYPRPGGNRMQQQYVRLTRAAMATFPQPGQPYLPYLKDTKPDLFWKDPKCWAAHEACSATTSCASLWSQREQCSLAAQAKLSDDSGLEAVKEEKVKCMMKTTFSQCEDKELLGQWLDMTCTCSGLPRGIPEVCPLVATFKGEAPFNSCDLLGLIMKDLSILDDEGLLAQLLPKQPQAQQVAKPSTPSQQESAAPKPETTLPPLTITLSPEALRAKEAAELAAAQAECGKQGKKAVLAAEGDRSLMAQ